MNIENKPDRNKYWRTVRAYYDEIWESKFNDFYKEYSRYFLEERKRLLSKYINLSEHEILVDIGCGSGLSLVKEISKARLFLGMDISLKCLKLLKNRLSTGYLINALAENIPLKENSINKIICVEVMEHIIDDEATIKEIYRVLIPGGIAIFNIPNGYSFFYWPKRIFRWVLCKLGMKGPYVEGETHWEHIGRVDHLRRYSRSRFAALLQNNGFLVRKNFGLFIDNGNRFNAFFRKLSDNAASYYFFTTLSKIFPSLGLKLFIVSEKKNNDH